jgi:hypothetical protein
MYCFKAENFEFLLDFKSICEYRFALKKLIQFLNIILIAVNTKKHLVLL